MATVAPAGPAISAVPTAPAVQTAQRQEKVVVAKSPSSLGKAVVKPTWGLAWGLLWRMLILASLIGLIVYLIVFAAMLAMGGKLPFSL
jgi:hypothetical protein